MPDYYPLPWWLERAGITGVALVPGQGGSCLVYYCLAVGDVASCQNRSDDDVSLEVPVAAGIDKPDYHRHTGIDPARKLNMDNDTGQYRGNGNTGTAMV